LLRVLHDLNRLNLNPQARPPRPFLEPETMNEDQTPNYASTPAQIVEYYDSHLNLTLRELSDMTGRTISQLKKIILADEKQNNRGQA
jgi:hypothetical protein